LILLITQRILKRDNTGHACQPLVSESGITIERLKDIKSLKKDLGPLVDLIFREVQNNPQYRETIDRLIQQNATVQRDIDKAFKAYQNISKIIWR
jgi:hypothetical protein